MSNVDLNAFMYSMHVCTQLTTELYCNCNCNISGTVIPRIVGPELELEVDLQETTLANQPGTFSHSKSMRICMYIMLILKLHILIAWLIKHSLNS